MKTVAKLFRVEWILFQLSAIADLQSRLNLLLQFFNDIVWYSTQIIVFETLYLHVNNLGGWGIVETRVFLGVLFLVDALQMVLFSYNFERFSDSVARGNLDMVLMKPVSSQFLMSSQRLACGYLLNAMIALIWLLWSLSSLPGGFPWVHSLLLFLVVPAGLGIFYATRMIICTFSLLFSQVTHFQELYGMLIKLGMRPDKIYSPGLRYLVLFVIPVGMIASVPARIIVESFDIWLLGELLAMSTLLLWLSNRFWHYALRHYT